MCWSNGFEFDFLTASESNLFTYVFIIKKNEKDFISFSAYIKREKVTYAKRLMRIGFVLYTSQTQNPNH